ncbi:hypothetical protein [Armatimonas sp.]|uniref:hypothetical protein n=1 Tax=Armatimonas sp. TaxID=1872638 RepID=UPI00286A1AB9|nr:hypothetical protein [Armatimonas sp.]
MFSSIISLIAVVSMAPAPSAVARSRAFWDNYGTCARSYVLTHEDEFGNIVPDLDGEGVFGQEIGSGITGIGVVCRGNMISNESWYAGNLTATLTNGGSIQSLTGVNIKFYVQGEIKNGGVYAASSIAMTFTMNGASDSTDGEVPVGNGYAPPTKSAGIPSSQTISMNPGSTLDATGYVWGHAKIP